MKRLCSSPLIIIEAMKHLKNKIISIYSIIVAMSFSACINSHKNNDVMEIYTPIVEPVKTEPLDITKLLPPAEVVYLDNSTKESMLSLIQDVKIEEEIIYILSDDAIYKFNMDGSFICKIKRYGRGHGEYLRLKRFDIDITRKEISVHDSEQRKILIYDLDGNFKRSFNIDDVVEDFARLPNGDYLFYRPKKLDVGRRGLWQSDSNGVFKKHLIEIDDSYEFGVILDYFLIKQKDGTVTLMGNEQYNYFYKITSDTIYTTYQMITDVEMKRNVQKNRVHDIKSDPSDAFFKYGYLETDKMLSFAVSGTSGNVRVYVDKENNYTYRIYNNDDKLPVEDGYLYPNMYYYSYKNMQICYLSVEAILSIEEHHKRFPDITSESNPLLFIAREQINVNYDQ